MMKKSDGGSGLWHIQSAGIAWWRRAYQKVTITSAGMAHDGFMNGEWNAPRRFPMRLPARLKQLKTKSEPISKCLRGRPGEFVRVYVIESSVALQAVSRLLQRGRRKNCKDRRPKCSTARTVVSLSTVLRHGSRGGRRAEKRLEPVDQEAGSTLEGMIGLPWRISFLSMM